MTQPTGAVLDAPAPTTAVPLVVSAAELAARIQIPRRLPVRYDGQPLRHLSNSSYTRFVLCAEDWRRWYLQGERPADGRDVPRSCVDDALTAYYRPQLEHGELLALDQVRDRSATHGAQGSTPNRPSTASWEPDLPDADAFRIGLDALALTFGELVPQLGRPVAVQRRLEFAIAAGLEWTVSATWTSRRSANTTPTLPPRGRRLQGQEQPDLAGQGRPRPAGRPVPRRTLARRPARPRLHVRADRQARRAAQADQQRAWSPPRARSRSYAPCSRASPRPPVRSHALYERYGPDEPWGFADPTGWKCTERYCQHWLRRAPAAPGSDHRSEASRARPRTCQPSDQPIRRRRAFERALRAPARTHQPGARGTPTAASPSNQPHRSTKEQFTMRNAFPALPDPAGGRRDRP